MKSWGQAQYAPPSSSVLLDGMRRENEPDPPAEPCTSGRPMYDDVYRPFKLFLAGGIAGAVSRTATAPVDRLKLLLQVNEAKRLTIREGATLMWREGSVKALFRGNGANVLKIAPETALKFAINDKLKHLVVEDPEQITPAERVVAGGLAGAFAQLCMYPLEMVRTRLAVCRDDSYRGIWQTAARIYREEGAFAFYRGLAPSMVGILPFAGVDICIFEILQEHLEDIYEGSRPPPHMILGAGMVSSSIAQFVSYPLALTRTRLCAQGMPGMPVKYKGMFDVLYQTLRHEGPRGLYKGTLPNMIKLAPAAGITWFVYEETKRLLGVHS